MMKPTTAKEAVGKTVQAIVNSWYGNKQLLISFTDGTFVTFGIQENEWGEESPVIQEEKLDLFAFGRDLLVEAGVCTEEELAAIKADAEAAASSRRLQRLVEEYSRLARVFKGKTPQEVEAEYRAANPLPTPEIKYNTDPSAAVVNAKTFKQHPEEAHHDKIFPLPNPMPPNYTFFPTAPGTGFRFLAEDELIEVTDQAWDGVQWVTSNPSVCGRRVSWRCKKYRRLTFDLQAQRDADSAVGGAKWLADRGLGAYPKEPGE
jgi:hypothetical protein